MATASRKKTLKTSAKPTRAQLRERTAKDTATNLAKKFLVGNGSLAKKWAVNDAQDVQVKNSGSNKIAKPDESEAAKNVAPIGMKADVTKKMLAAAPGFGEVLKTIGHAVALTQTALDETALESLKTLSGQTVNVPVLIEQTLDDDGKPTTVNIVTAAMPLTSIIVPSMQMVDQMTLRMDMRVESANATSGIKFNQNMISAGVIFDASKKGKDKFSVNAGFNNTNINSQFSSMSDFSSGSVMVSLDIVDRTGFQIPAPLTYGIGASLSVKVVAVTQTKITSSEEPPVTTFDRAAKLKIKKIAESGAVSDATLDEVSVTIPAGLTYSPITGGVLLIKRTCDKPTDPFEERKIFLQFGDLVKEVTFNL